MAILEDGPNGGFRGKVGSVYGYNLKGQWIIRGARRKSNKPPTEAQRLHRQKMKAVGQFCAENKAVFDFGYELKKEKGSKYGAFQLAQKHVFNDVLAFDAAYNPVVSFENLNVFVGDLTPPEGAKVSVNDGRICLEWTPNPTYDDEIYKLNLACVSLKDFCSLKLAIASARDGQCVVDIPVELNQKAEYHVYIGYWDTYRGAFSNSAYCGII
ncbi:MULTISPECIES: DUF6266 family protein [Sphingobacterium]|uniref:Uncharacterized protein n=1 Tax=Sphingobacterium athyrii TaxID=2152717 RepID=A0A363NRZ8_9SPHI|nr:MULTISPECIES: DUF6266 family protein [Sphingobacterium]PUV23507.1 hypothetical protein DCO56_16455 [Sphingobacterium athyrii]QIH36472.1 hypothetical protein G6053_28020 [Sphingobacterium sp. DR205]